MVVLLGATSFFSSSSTFFVELHFFCSLSSHLSESRDTGMISTLKLQFCSYKEIFYHNLLKDNKTIILNKNIIMFIEIRLKITAMRKDLIWAKKCLLYIFFQFLLQHIIIFLNDAPSKMISTFYAKACWVWLGRKKLG